MLSTNKMAALPTCDDMGSESQRFSDFLCVMHIVPSTKSRFIEFSKDSWSKCVSFGTKWKKIDCREGEIEIGLRLYTTVHVCWNLDVLISRTILSDEDFEDDVNSEADE